MKSSQILFETHPNIFEMHGMHLNFDQFQINY